MISNLIVLEWIMALVGVGHMLANPTRNLHANQWQLFWPALCQGIRQAGLPRRVAASGEPASPTPAPDEASTLAC